LKEVAAMRIEEKVNEVLKIHRIVDADVHRFGMKSGLSCLRFCSRCCSSVRVTATVLEMLPLAYWFYKKQTAQFWLEKLDDAGEDGERMCILLRFPKRSRNVGRCMAYKMRPLICRLFGFAAVFDKNNQPQLVTCKVIKKIYHQAYLEIALSLRTLHVPIMKRYYAMLYPLDFMQAQRFYPLNEALRLAIETVLFHFSYHRQV
jgi:Fe-S-cluster containining protein